MSLLLKLFTFQLKHFVLLNNTKCVICIVDYYKNFRDNYGLNLETFDNKCGKVFGFLWKIIAIEE